MTLRKVQHNWRMFGAIRLVAITFGLVLVAASSYSQTWISRESFSRKFQEIDQ
jgi:hypothetical protein